MIVILLTQLSGISAQDTSKETIIPVPLETGKLIVKDLESYDLCVHERRSLKERVSLLKDKVNVKDSLINSLDSNVTDCRSVVRLRKKQINNQKEQKKLLEQNLEKVNKQRNSAIGVGIIVIVLIIVFK